MSADHRMAPHGAVEKRRLTPRFRPLQAEKIAPCQVSCATSGDVRGWIGVVAQRDKIGLSTREAYARAWEIITQVNPFPSVMGRVCPHPCEAHCNRSGLDEAVSINAMERFLGDWALQEELPLKRNGVEPRQESLGVIGAGPSGLSFAYQMARRGYPVVVYESKEQPGGMLRYGIPDYRLPPEILDAEIARILDLGVELRSHTRVGADVTMGELRARHGALYLGVGAQLGLGVDIPGMEGPGVWTGTEYLNAVNRGKRPVLGSRTVVVGGGNTAVDAARAARRAGAEVTILYRRSREEMPAIHHEIEEALEEGVELMLLVAPLRLERADGAPHTLLAQRMRLGEPDASGRRRPIPVPGSEFMLRVDSLIAAVSQKPDLFGLEVFARDTGWLRTDGTGLLGDNVWAGGDVLGLGIAGLAIAQGRRAAQALHARLEDPEHCESIADKRAEIELSRIHVEFHEERPAAKVSPLCPTARLLEPSQEVSKGISEAAFLQEAERCFSCGACFGCQLCAMYCTVGGFVRLPEARPGSYFALSLDECEECGKCIEVCPCGFLEVTHEAKRPFA